MKQIEITVTKAGDVKIETSGYSGNDCLLATYSYQKHLGKSTNDKAKPELYATNTLNQEVTQ